MTETYWQGNKLVTKYDTKTVNFLKDGDIIFNETQKSAIQIQTNNHDTI